MIIWPITSVKNTKCMVVTLLALVHKYMFVVLQWWELQCDRLFHAGPAPCWAVWQWWNIFTFKEQCGHPLFETELRKPSLQPHHPKQLCRRRGRDAVGSGNPVSKDLSQYASLLLTKALNVMVLGFSWVLIVAPSTQIHPGLQYS